MAEFQIRKAGAEDAKVFAHHRAEMFKAMAVLDPGVLSDFEAASTEFFKEAMAGDRWHGWLADSDGKVIGGAVFHSDVMPPRNGPDHRLVPSAPQGLIMNVYVEEDWRRRGVARALVNEILSFARSLGAASVTLHASKDGKALYEQMGFTPTHEMRLFL